MGEAISLDRGSIKQLQEFLGVFISGVYNNTTKKAVTYYQLQNNLVANGDINRETLESMGILDTDLKSGLSFKTETGLTIIKHHLPEGEFIREDHIIQNDYIFFHHTSGWNNPFNVIDQWGRDARGAIATEFVIGGQNVKNGDEEFDGVTLQAFPEGCQAWHLGKTGSYYMNKHSVGIEMCSFGGLDENFKTYVKTQAHSSQVVSLEQPFRGFTHWHGYSDKQLKSLKGTLLHAANRDNIDLCTGIVEWIEKDGPEKAFGFQPDAFNGDVQGLLTHTNVRKDKSDCFPQQELVDMLLSL